MDFTLEPSLPKFPKLTLRDISRNRLPVTKGIISR